MRTIKFLVDNNGQEIMEVEDLKDWTNRYFQLIYNPISIQVSNNMKEITLNLVNLVVNNQMNETMIGKLNRGEVRKVVFSMNQYKAQVLMGFPQLFLGMLGYF